MESPARGVAVASRRAVDSASTICPTHRHQVKKEVVLNRPSGYYHRAGHRDIIIAIGSGVAFR
jgi:hypothetical protein